MNQLKLKCRVILIPTDELGYKSKDIVKGVIDDKLWVSTYKMSAENNPNYIAQKMYLVSDEKIKEGDFFVVDDRDSTYEDENFIGVEKCISRERGFVFGNHSKMDVGYSPNFTKKIIATTDILPDLPEVPQGFKEKYVKSQGTIKEVMVEMGEFYVGYGKLEPGIKVRKDNTVIVSKLNTDNNMYNLEQLRAAFDAGVVHGCNPDAPENDDTEFQCYLESIF